MKDDYVSIQIPKSLQGETKPDEPIYNPLAKTQYVAYPGDKFFHLKTTHGVSWTVAVYLVMVKYRFVIDWISFVQEARKNKWYDFQTVKAIESSLQESGVDRTLVDGIMLRMKHYMQNNKQIFWDDIPNLPKCFPSDWSLEQEA